MISYTLTIPGTLPGLNEYIAAERSHRQAAALMKRSMQDLIRYEIRRQLRGVKITSPVFMAYSWIEKNKRRDKDNIAFAKKFIQDSLVAEGVLLDDGWRHIEGFRDEFFVDARNPRVEVVIEVE